MANRPVFLADKTAPFFFERGVEFEWMPGLSAAQKQRSCRNLHAAFVQRYPGRRVLEISSKSTEPLGVALSAFNLMLTVDGVRRPVECVFQGGKVFEDGGPYTDLLDASPRDAKRDERLRTSGLLTGFRLGAAEFPLRPKTFFYDWLYLNALHQNPDLAGQLLAYDAFTDIEFNPQKSLNCQARAAATYVGLHRAGLLEAALSAPQAYLLLVHKVSAPPLAAAASLLPTAP